MSFNRVCKQCGEANGIGALFCNNCGEQLYKKEKFENLTGEELKLFKNKKMRLSLTFMLLTLHCFFAIFLIYHFLFNIFQLIFIGYITICIFVITCIFFFIYGLKLIFDMVGTTFYINLKDKAAKMRHTHAMELLKTKKLKKISKDTMKELRLKFQQFDEDFNQMRVITKRYYFYIIFNSILFLIAFSSCLIINFYFKNFLLSITFGITLSLFFLYPIQSYMREINLKQQQITDLVLNISQVDQADFIYYIEAIGIKAVSRYSWSCFIILLILIVILFLNISINYDLPIHN